jgi:7-carboxy-7-deazaguanine synthase
MPYRIKEIFVTLQGEGANTGRVAVFCRFSGCNLWSGREGDREASVCGVCDTDFVGTDGPGGGIFETPGQLARAAARRFPGGRSGRSRPFVVLTGGEPLLQLDPALIRAFHDEGFEVGVETNGTCAVPHGLDWVCVSPKAGAELRVTSGDELKLLFPQNGMNPQSFEGLDFRYFFLQPVDGPEIEECTKKAIEYCLAHPQWRLSVQTHKLIGIR